MTRKEWKNIMKDQKAITFSYDDGIESEIRELCLARDPNDASEDDKEVHDEFVEKLLTRGILKGPGSKAFLNAFTSFPTALYEKMQEMAER